MRPAYPRQDAELEPRGPQAASLPPEHAPHRALGHQAVVRDEQSIVRPRDLRLAGGVREAVAQRGLVGVRLVRLGGRDHGGAGGGPGTTPPATPPRAPPPRPPPPPIPPPPGRGATPPIFSGARHAG